MVERWEQRFQNFERAFLLLKDALDGDIDDLSDLEKKGVIQRFEYTFELAWKTLKDYLVHQGIVFDQVTPRAVIKAAFSAQVVIDGALWVDMLGRRNLMSRVYDQQKFHETIVFISTRYLEGFDELWRWLKAKIAEE